MNEIDKVTLYFSIFITLFIFYMALKIKNRYKSSLFNPLFVSIIVMIIVLRVIRMPAEIYHKNTEVLMYLLTPATVCLALPMYESLYLLKVHWKALVAGISAGVITNFTSVFLLSKILGLSFKEFVTILPKSITSSMGLSLSEELGGDITVTILAVIVTGVLGNVMSDAIFYRLKLKNKMVRGVALGTCAHAIGTARAMEYGKSEGGMASIAIVLSGVLTVILISICTGFY